MLTSEQYIKERYLLEFRKNSNCRKANLMEERAFIWWNNGKHDWIPFREVRVKNNNIQKWIDSNPWPEEFLPVYVGDQHWHSVYMLHRKVGKWILP